MTKYVQAMVTGIGTGAVYALVAYGISLVYAVTRTVNLAHGEVMMTAVFASLTALTYGAAAWLAIAAGLGAAALLGLVLDRVVMTPLAGRREPMSWFLGVVMFAAVLRGAATLLFGSRTYPLPIDIGGDAIIRLGGAAFKATYVWILGLALVLAAAFQVLVARTAFGR
ncbi:MAG TPA: hypothetical protein VEO00_07615, partial [Actinomycetota bacterium]|nr:hypothetical protein [Actinomycetota bacterium]